VNSHILALQGTGEIPGLADVARRQQHAGDNQLLDGIGIRPRRIEDRDAGGAHALDGNVVDACPGTTDRLDRRGQFHVVHIEGSQQDGIRVLDLGGNFVGIPGKMLQPGGRDIVQCENFLH